MKLKDIKLGVEYFSNSHTSWEDSSWGQKRIRVIDLKVQRWKMLADKTWGCAPSYSHYSTGVLVEELHVETGVVIWTGAATLASIRGEWEPTLKAFKDRQAMIAERKRKDNQAHQLKQQATGTAVAKAKQMSIPGVKADAYGRVVEVDPKVFAAMLAHLDLAGWTYNPNAEVA